MATLDQTLKLLITADGRGLSAGLTKATGELKNFGATAQRAFGGIQTAFAALGVTLSTGAFVVGIKKIIDGFDSLNDASKRLGVTTESLSALGYAAEQSGSSLEGIQTGLRFLNRNLIEAREGNKELAATFRQLGLTATEDTEKALLRIADAFAKLPDGAQKTAFAMKLFGRSGAELIPLLNEGSAGIEKFRAEAERMGLIVSGSAAKAADDFNDSLNSLTKSVTAVGISIANSALPLLNQFATAMSDAARDGGSLLDILGKLAIEIENAFWFGTGREGLFSELSDAEDRLKEAEEAVARYKRIRDGLEDEPIGSRLRRTVTGQSITEQIEAWADQAGKAQAKIDTLKAKIEQLNGVKAGKGIAADVEQITGAAREAAEEIAGLQATYKNLVKEIKEGAKSAAAGPVKDVKQSTVLDINRLYDQAQRALEQGDAESAQTLIDQARKVNDYLLETKQVTQSYYQTQAARLLELAQQGQAVLDGNPLTLPVAPDLDQAMQAGMLASEAAQSGVKPIVIPGVVQIAPNSFTDAASAPRVEVSAAGITGLAAGGAITGPGTSLSDSILARLSAGEFVVRAAAVKNYGLGFLERLNAMALPRFAAGGPVGTPVNIVLPGGQSFGMTAQPSVAKQLASILSTEVLKRGRRG